MNYLGSTQKKTNVTFLCSSNKMYSHYSPLSQKKLLLSVYAANSNLPASEASVNIPDVLWKEQTARCSTHTGSKLQLQRQNFFNYINGQLDNTQF